MNGPGDRSTTRAVYDATAGAYAEAIGTRLNPAFEGPIDRALLGAFAEMVRGSVGPVGDLGCGPGRVAAFLADRDVATLGLDLSESMVRIGSDAHDGIPFGAADLAHLPLADGVLAGAVCWYSVIHTPADELADVFGEVARTLRTSAPLLVAFQTGEDERIERPDAHGSGHRLTNHRHHVDTVARALSTAGFHLHSRTVREPAASGEPTPQAFLLAHAGVPGPAVG